MNKKSHNIFIIGGHFFSSLPKQWLQSRGHSVTMFDSEKKCLEALAEEPCDILVVAANGSADTVVELLKKFPQNRQYLLPILVVVKNGDITASIKAAKAGAAEVLEEPLDEAKLVSAIESMLKRNTNNHFPTLTLLTDTEKQILKLVLNGHSSREIAEKMDRSPRTIEDHRSQIMQKVGVDNVIDLAKYAIKTGFIAAESEKS
jgi:two-component system, LuxR family, response regulator FixJ